MPVSDGEEIEPPYPISEEASPNVDIPVQEGIELSVAEPMALVSEESIVPTVEDLSRQESMAPDVGVAVPIVVLEVTIPFSIAANLKSLLATRLWNRSHLHPSLQSQKVTLDRNCVFVSFFFFIGLFQVQLFPKPSLPR